MKRVLLLAFVLAALAGCATPELTPDQQKVRPICDTNNCQFIKTAYFEASHPSKVHYYATKNVLAAGGDSYQIMNSGQDAAVGVKIYTTTIGIYKCNK